MGERKKKERIALSASVVMDALRKSTIFNAENARSPCAIIEEVSNGTGTRANRRADALVVSLWPSRGIWFAGVEVKVSRTDWTNEIKNPAKAAAILRWCNFWWLVAAEGVALSEEIPETWGWIEVVARASGVACHVRKHAPRLTPEPLAPDFVAAILRKVAAGEDARNIAATNKAMERLIANRFGYDEAEVERLRRVEREYDRLKTVFDEFCEASGETPNDIYFNTKKVGQARALAMAIIERGYQHGRRDMPKSLRELADKIEGAQKELEFLKDQGEAALKDVVTTLRPNAEHEEEACA